ncbi:MAG: aldose 1-epimerase [Phycisphaerales bacterium]
MPLIQLTADRLRLSINPLVGASIADFSMQGPAKYAYPIMRRAAPKEVNPSAHGSFFMAPWCNRLAGGKLRFGGKEHQLRCNGSDGSAMHGDVRERPWALLDRTPNTARLEFDSRANPGVNFPWPFAVRARYELSATALDIDLAVHNLGDQPMPAGCGHHPYFMRRLWSERDVLQVHCPVRARFPLTKGIPSGPAAAEELTRRLGTMQAAPEELIDTVFDGFSGRAKLVWPGSGIALDITCSSNLGHLVFYTPVADGPGAAPLPFIAVEPVSQVNNGFNMMAEGTNDTGSIVLRPGEALETTMRLAVSML